MEYCSKSTKNGKISSMTLRLNQRRESQLSWTKSRRNDLRILESGLKWICILRTLNELNYDINSNHFVPFFFLPLPLPLPLPFAIDCIESFSAFYLLISCIYASVFTIASNAGSRLSPNIASKFKGALYPPAI